MTNASADSSSIKWDLLIDTIIDNKCVLLLGPDAVHYRKGKSMSQLLRDTIPQQVDGGVHYQANDGLFMFADEKAKIEAYYKIKKQYKEVWADPDFYARPMYGQLARIPFSLYISVNPDLFLKHALEEKGIDHAFYAYVRKTKPAEILAPDVNKPLVYNLMGEIEEKDSLILSHDDMFSYLHSILGVYELPTELQNALREADTFIFLGFQFSQWYMQLMLRLLNMYFKEDKYQYAFARNIENDVRSFFVDEFKIEFVDEDEQGFVEQLYKQCQEEAILREEKSAASGEGKKESEVIRELINQDELSEAINRMHQFFNAHDEDLANDALLVANKYNRLHKKIKRGIITDENAEVEQSKIAQALHDMLEDVVELETT